MKRFMKSFVILASLLALVCVPVMASAANADGVNNLGSWTDPITGENYQFVQAKTSDCLRLNQSIVYVTHTEVKLDERTHKYMPKTDMIRVDAASGNGIVHGFFYGGFAGLAQGAGFATGMALLRPSTTSVNANGNTGVESSQGQIAGATAISNASAIGTKNVIEKGYKNHFGDGPR